MKLPAHPSTPLTQTWDSSPLHNRHIESSLLSLPFSSCVNMSTCVFPEDNNYNSQSLKTLKVPLIHGSYVCHLQSRKVKSPVPQSLETHPLQG